MTPPRSRPSRRAYHAASLLLALALLACGGAYSKAVERGDRYAAAGQWEQAEAEYRRAIALDPDDPEAIIRLEKLKERRSQELLERARAFAARGETERALKLVSEAARLRPDDAAIQKELSRLAAELVGRAEALLAGDKAEEAFTLAAAVLEAAPRHPRARRVDREAREVLAAAAFERAGRFSDEELPGNAMLELARALWYRPRFAEARLELGRIKLALEQELAFVVGLEPFAGDRRSRFLAHALTPAVLGQAIDQRLLVRVAGAEAGGEAGVGVLVGGLFTGYTHQRDRHSEQRSCDYVCGTDSKPNPRRREVEMALGQSEQSLARAESEVSRHETDVARHESQVADKQKKVDSEQADLDRAQQRYDQCMERAKPEESSPCWSEKSSLDSARRDLESARSAMRWPRDDLERGRRSLGSARESRDRARRDVEDRRRVLRETPAMIEVPRYCGFDYAIAVHEVAASVTMSLSIARRHDQVSVVKGEPFRYDVRQKDVSFPAHPGRCAEVAGGDPLRLPGENDLRRELLGKVVADVRAKVMASYDAYRARFLAVARKHESGGMTEAAIEAYVRYVLTGPHQLEGAEAIQRFLEKARGFGDLEAFGNL